MGATLLNSPPNSAKHLSRMREETAGGRKGILTLNLFLDWVDSGVLAFSVLRDLDNKGEIRPLTLLLHPLEIHFPLQANPIR